MSNLKILFILPVLVVVGGLVYFIATGGKEEEKVSTSDSRVRVINEDESSNSNNNAQPVQNNLPDEVEDADEKENDKADETKNDDKIKDEEDSDETADDSSGTESTIVQELKGATAKDGVTVNTYTYGVEGGKMQFIWGVRNSTGTVYPTVKVSYDSDNNLVLTFPDIVADYVAESIESPLELGGNLPDVKVETIEGGSKYTFMFGEKNPFTITGSESDREVVLEVTL